MVWQVHPKMSHIVPSVSSRKKNSSRFVRYLYLFTYFYLSLFYSTIYTFCFFKKYDDIYSLHLLLTTVHKDKLSEDYFTRENKYKLVLFMYKSIALRFMFLFHATEYVHLKIASIISNTISSFKKSVFLKKYL